MFSVLYSNVACCSHKRSNCHCPFYVFHLKNRNSCHVKKVYFFCMIKEKKKYIIWKKKQETCDTIFYVEMICCWQNFVTTNWTENEQPRKHISLNYEYLDFVEKTLRWQQKNLVRTSLRLGSWSMALDQSLYFSPRLGPWKANLSITHSQPEW